MFKLIVFIGFCVFTTVSSSMDCITALNDYKLYTSAPDWKDILAILNQYREKEKENNSKYSLLINLLKTLLADEIDKARCNIIEENTEQNQPIVISCVEEQSVVNSTFSDKITDSKNVSHEQRELKEILANIALVETKSKAKTSKSEANADVPAMIPIFKPKTKSKNDKKQPAQKKTEVKQSKRENGTKVNSNPAPKKTEIQNFEIPCQRTSDILDSSYLIPKDTCGKCGLNKNPIDQNINASFQKSKPDTSVSCVESDDIIAMLFKPKFVTLMQVYGNLLKKITITVLVPLYVSKLTV